MKLSFGKLKSVDLIQAYLRIGNGLVDWQWICGLVMDWRIGSRLVMDRHMIGRLAEDWHRIDMDRRISKG